MNSFPNRHAEKHDLEYDRGDNRPGNTLQNNLVLKIAQPLIIDLELALGNHEFVEEPLDGRDARAVRGALFVLDALPGQLLPAREEKQQETGAACAGEHEGEADDPKRGRAKAAPAQGVVDRGGGKRDQQHGEETEGDEGDADDGDHAQGLEGAVLDAQADEVAVGAVLEQVVDVVQDRGESLWCIRCLELGADVLSHAIREVEFLGGR